MNALMSAASATGQFLQVRILGTSGRSWFQGILSEPSGGRILGHMDVMKTTKICDADDYKLLGAAFVLADGSRLSISGIQRKWLFREMRVVAAKDSSKVN